MAREHVHVGFCVLDSAHALRDRWQSAAPTRNTPRLRVNRIFADCKKRPRVPGSSGTVRRTRILAWKASCSTVLIDRGVSNGIFALPHTSTKKVRLRARPAKNGLSNAGRRCVCVSTARAKLCSPPRNRSRCYFPMEIPGPLWRGLSGPTSRDACAFVDEKRTRLLFMKGKAGLLGLSQCRAGAGRASSQESAAVTRVRWRNFRPET